MYQNQSGITYIYKLLHFSGDFENCPPHHKKIGMLLTFVTGFSM
jgi:hypothetical protein